MMTCPVRSSCFYFYFSLKASTRYQKDQVSSGSSKSDWLQASSSRCGVVYDWPIEQHVVVVVVLVSALADVSVVADVLVRVVGRGHQ